MRLDIVNKLASKLRQTSNLSSISLLFLGEVLPAVVAGSDPPEHVITARRGRSTDSKKTVNAEKNAQKKEGRITRPTK
jgi:hypothetical protein